MLGRLGSMSTVMKSTIIASAGACDYTKGIGVFAITKAWFLSRR